MLGFNPIADNPLASLIVDTSLTLSGQTVTIAQAALNVTADSVELLVRETALLVTQNSVSTTADANYTLAGQVLNVSQNSVTITADANYTLIGQNVTLTQNSTLEEVSPTLGSQNIQLSLHSMRMWNKIDPSQSANWSDINTAQSSNWTHIDTTQNPAWTEIPT